MSSWEIEKKVIDDIEVSLLRFVFGLGYVIPGVQKKLFKTISIAMLFLLPSAFGEQGRCGDKCLYK